MPFFLNFARAVSEGCEHFDEYVVTATPERSRFLRNFGRRPPELMGENGATWGDGALHRLHKDVPAVATKGRKAAAFHEHALPIGQIGIEQFQRGAVRPHVDRAEEDPSKFEKWRQAGFTLVPLTAPR